ncbi:HK97-gp10 family putative phage morphogenesis protein [Aquabacterium sp. OR-4]|uniref:HK97-gp10 family putative phage morphogenesis protein n=1 Tax=Aquabacterium sp. OR-4 TaxID=2978127 RepID=UPI0021B423AE|nr:HK97-gp10 family putative phage morphogenesis protein [Aquabacterium sp. OR-4]MDT7836457.1 HK97 gp10 family phage protein [Aquabacterium sp. OR-4]
MISAKVQGIPALKAALAGLVPKLRRQVLRNALAAGARIVRDDARRRAPVLQPTLKTPVRKPGTVRAAIVVRTSKAARRAGDVGVFVNVRPAKRGQRGAKSPHDPYYWRWLEFGTKKMAAIPFLQPASQRLSDALEKFKQVVGPQIDKMNRKGGTQ